jgi:hypothetical protein
MIAKTADYLPEDIDYPLEQVAHGIEQPIETFKKEFYH